jgi:PAS domain S-box-containing protein
MTNKESAREWEDPANPMSIKLLVTLGRLGLKTVRAKLLACALSLIALSVALSSALTYLSFAGALDTAGQSSRGAGGTPAGFVWRITLTGLLVFVAASVPVCVLAAGLSNALRKIALTARNACGASDDKNIAAAGGDELEELGGDVGRMARRISEAARVDRVQSALYRITSESYKAVDTHDLYGRVHKIIGDLMYARNFFIAIYDEAASTVSFPYWADEADPAPQPRALRKGLTEHVLLTGQALLTSEESFREMVRRGDLEQIGEPPIAWLGVPLKVGERTIGAIAAQSYDKNNLFDEEDKEVLTFVSQHVAIVLERGRREEALRDSQASFISIVDSLPQNILGKDLEGKFIFGNKAFRSTLGMQVGELTGKTDFDLFPKELAEKYREDDRRVAETGQVLDTVEAHVTPDGKKIYVQVVKSPMRDSKQAVTGTLGIFWDVTERKEMEEAIKRSELEYKNLFDQANDAILIFEPEAETIIAANNQACQTYGFAREELVGMSLKKLICDAETRKDRVSEILRTRENKSFETVHVASDGRLINMLASCSLIEYEGKPAILSMFRDITERRQAERALEASLNNFASFVSVVSEGDLLKRGEEGDQALGRVNQSVNRMLDNFAAMLTEVKQIGLSVSSSATEILAAAEQIAVGSQRQADEVTNTSTAVEEMAASMSQVSRNAESSAEAARRALEMAEHGDRSVRDTSEAMSRIDEAVQQTAEKMRLLGKRSSEISEIIDLIDEIASQTNLLALNAAIEAAHAGEAGLGFSVVAEEIRKLAERSARATKDVGSLIKAIQGETTEAVSAMENGMKEVKGGTTLAEQASRALQDISSVVRRSAELIMEISAASEEQARVTSNVAGAMQTISSITLETSAGAQQTAQTIQGMVELCERLNEAISQFRVAEEYPRPFTYANNPAQRAGSDVGDAMRYRD